MKAEIADDVNVLQLPPNSEVYGLLTVLMDWISDEHLSKLQRQERKDGQKPQSSERTSLEITRLGNQCGILEFCFYCFPLFCEGFVALVLALIVELTRHISALHANLCNLKSV